MKLKAAITFFIIANCFVSCLSRAALRRTPKVYNALITTDENLTSSRAFPVIQPTIHETGVAHYPFGPYSGFGYYGPSVVRFGQPIAPGLVQREQLPYPLPHMQFPPQLMPHPGQPVFGGYPAAQHPPTAPPPPTEDAVLEGTEQDLKKAAVPPVEEQQPVVPPKDAPAQSQVSMPVDENGPREVPNEKLPIPLNQFGLPPSLIPLQQFPIRRNGNSHINPNHVNLPPYGFNQYPLLPGYYDPITGFREQFLPPYDYAASPHQTYAIASQPAAAAKNQAILNNSVIPAPVLTEQNVDETSTFTPETTEAVPDTAPLSDVDAPDFESIKNASKNKNSEVPDVPPPPIPSGAKTKPSS